MITTAHPLLLDETLVQIFSYLDGRSLISSRLVCTAWNIAALPLFPGKVKIGAEILVQVPGSARTFSKEEFFQSVTFGRKKFLDSNQASDWANVLRALIRKDFCNAATYLDVNCLMKEPRNVDSIAMAVNLGFFPNLKKLKIRNLNVSSTYNAFFIPGSLDFLETLQISVAGKNEDPYFQNYCQKLVDAAMNVRFLKLEIPVRLDKHLDLEHLVFRARGRDVCNLSYSDQKLLSMLASADDRLLSLTLRDVYLPFDWLPEMESLLELGLYNTRLDNTCLEMSFPNLACLRHSCKDFGWHANWTVKAYLKMEPESLECYETVLWNGWEEAEHIRLARELPREVWFVLHVGLSLTAERKKMMSYVLNLDRDFVWVKISDDCRISSLIKAIKLAKLERRSRGRYKGNAILFQFTSPEVLRKRNPDIDFCEDDRMIKSFGRAMRKVSGSWDHVRLTGFRVSSKWVGKMHSDIRKWKLPVELEFGLYP